MDLVSATRDFTEKRRIANAAYEALMDASAEMLSARSEFELSQVVPAYHAANLAYERANEAAREARRVMGNLSAGIGSIGSVRR